MDRNSRQRPSLLGRRQKPSFGQNIGYQRVLSADGQYQTIPNCPDVKLRELPFFDILAVLIRPTTLVSVGPGYHQKQEVQHTFRLTATQAGDIASSKDLVMVEGRPPSAQYTVQVQLRFCVVDTTEEQDDKFPPNLVVKLNGRSVALPLPIPSNRPGEEPKRPSKYLNITNSLKCSPTTNNILIVQWTRDSTDPTMYAMSVNIVKKLSSNDLFERLKSKTILPPEVTEGRIKELTTAKEDDVCAPTSIRVSVACPLGKNRMMYPCHGITCKHLQCFDAKMFFLMNEKRPTFICPVCNNRLKFGDLCIDGYFMDVIRDLAADEGNDIELYPDGSWEPPAKVKSEAHVGPPPPKRMKPDNPRRTSKLSSATGKGPADLDEDEISII